MNNLFNLFFQRLAQTNTKFVRYLYSQIDWESRLIGITGARGAGKTTILLQYANLQFPNSRNKVLYVTLDHIWFSNNSLFDLGEEFVRNGGEVLLIDEVHKYQTWAQEIKNLYDFFPQLKIVFTGSSMLEIYRGNADLSRRAVHYVLHGMSFREFILYDRQIELPVFEFEKILNSHIEYAGIVNEKIKVIPAFKSYLESGYYPYYKTEKKHYHEQLLNTVNTILDVDLPSIETIEPFSIQKIKKLLLVIAQRVPFTPNITDLATLIGVNRNYLLNFLHILEKAQLLNLLQQDVSGLRTLSKPEKIYLNNTNLIYALESEKPDIGNLRETFFFNQLKAVGEVAFSKKADFIFKNKYAFEVGGKNKGHEQIAGLENAYLALDNLEYGYANKIPLWLFGMLY
ncbi:MAG: AAA family ATPase [Prevotellaceae bacterium]|jgi:predicted AAA+ superfamily ATPase|nr:AAA family ATPase [Prevotellaceae bacterium]